MSQKFSQNFCKIIIQFLGKAPINAKFFRYFLKLVYRSLFKCLSKTFQNFLNFLKSSLNFALFCRGFPTSLSHFFFRINSNLFCNFSKALLQKSLKSSWNLRKIFQWLIQNYFKLSQKFFQNFCKIISQFLKETCINARFFRTSLQLVYCSHFFIFFQ